GREVDVTGKHDQIVIGEAIAGREERFGIQTIQVRLDESPHAISSSRAAIHWKYRCAPGALSTTRAGSPNEQAVALFSRRGELVDREREVCENGKETVPAA